MVGVEANPLALPQLERRFEAEIADGRYVLLPIGIAEADGQAPFWVCDDHPEWSSFDRSIASRNGASHHCVTVETCRFASIVERFGAATYCKIDIEGNDDLCLEDLTPARAPRFLSVELVHGARQVRLLQELGYTRFKIISQRTLRQTRPRMLRFKARLPTRARRLVAAAEVTLTRNGSDGHWRFPRGSSGPFGDDTPGEWRTVDQALETCRRILELGGDLSEWHDIHAARDEPA